MKLLRYIALIIPLLVMMGHDVVPHVHDTFYAETADHAVVPAPTPSSSNTSLSGLLSGFEHSSSAANAIVYTVSTEQQDDVSFDLPAIPVDDYAIYSQIQWHTNLKKQRFRDEPSAYLQRCVQAFPHRGPPVA